MKSIRNLTENNPTSMKSTPNQRNPHQMTNSQSIRTQRNTPECNAKSSRNQRNASGVNLKSSNHNLIKQIHAKSTKSQPNHRNRKQINERNSKNTGPAKIKKLVGPSIEI